MNVDTALFPLKETNAYKKVALLLRCTHPKDQKWLMSRLSKQQSILLKKLIMEAESIGIEPSEDQLKSTLKEISSEKEENHCFSKKIDSINSIPAQKISHTLSEEPEETIAFILAIENWSWSMEILNAYNKRSKNVIKKERMRLMGKIPKAAKTSTLNFLLKELGLTSNEEFGRKP